MRKPFDTANDTKKQKKSVEFMDQLSLFCLSATKTHWYTRAALSHRNFHMHECSHTPV